MYAIMKLKYEAPIYDDFGFGAIWDVVKVWFRLINPLIKSSIVLDSLQWNEN